MQFRKIAAVAGSALMTGMMLAVPITAATNVGNIASLATPSDSVANFPIFVIGKTAQTSDVAGAVDIAVRMAAESKTTTTVTTTGTGAAVDGIERDGINIGTSSTLANNDLDNAITGGAAFPTGSLLKTTHYSKLKDSTFSFKSNDYDFREQVDASGVRMRHALDVDKINGTEKMVVGTNGDVKYEFVFEKTINLSTATTAGNTGTISNPEYTNPIKIKMMGKDFTIVGVGATSIKMLSGSIGTAKKQGTTVSGVVSGDYTVYVTAGTDNNWASFEIKDKTGNVVDTVSGISEGNSKDSSVSGLTIKVTDSRVSGTDPSTQIIEADIVVGLTGQVEHEYDVTADVDSTGTANEAFPGAPRWGIQYSLASSGSGNGQIGSGGKIQVVYKPKETEYYIAGQALSLPNDFAKLGFQGWNTDTFAEITIKPYGAATGYFQNGTSISGATLYGLEISSAKSGAIVSPANNFYSKAYVLFNASRGTASPVLIGYPDTSGKILTNSTVGGTEDGGWVSHAAGEVYNNVEYGYGLLRGGGNNDDQFNYTFKVNAGETDYFINVRVGNITTTGLPVIRSVTAGTSSNGDVVMGYTNKTVWTSSGASQLSDQFVKLGATSTTSEETELNITTEGTANNAGKKTIEIVADSGLLVQNPSSQSSSDAVVFKVPSKVLGVKVYFGKLGAATAADGTTTSTVIPVTTDVVKLDTEMTDAVKTGNNLVLVGGPCVNTLVASLATDGKFDYKCDASAAGTQPEWPAENFGIVKVVQDAFATGKVAVVVAGTRAQDTDLAALAIQSGKLSSSTASSVKLTGADINSLVIV